MKIIHNTKLFNRLAEKIHGKLWLTGKNKQGKQLVKEVAIILEEVFTTEDAGFQIPVYEKFSNHGEYIELHDAKDSIENALIIKVEEGDEIPQYERKVWKKKEV